MANLFRDDFVPWCDFFLFFFSKSCQSLDIMVCYHHVQYIKKTNDPILRKLSDGWTDQWIDRWTDGHTDTQTDGQE